MKKLLLLLAVCCALPAFAQELVTANLAASASSCEPGTNAASCLFLQINPLWNTVGASLSGVGTGSVSGTFQFEGKIGAIWTSVAATPSGTSPTDVTSATAAGNWTIKAGGYSWIRIRCSSSGSATATLNPSQAVTAGSGGGSGSGGDTITSPNGTVTVGGTAIATTLDSAPSKVCLPGSFAAQTDGATVTWAIGSNMCANASLLFTAHSGSRTLNLTGMVNGGNYELDIYQDATGGEGLTLGSGCTWLVSGGGGGAILPSTGANALDVLVWSYDGTHCKANFAKNFN